MASDQSKKTQLERQTHVIELTSGVQTDQFAESVPILDSNNTEVLPGKSGMFNRRGHARWTKYAPKTDPVGRIALVVDSQPPNLSDGTWLISAVDTSVPTNPIVYLQPFKPRTNLSNDTLVSRVYFDKAAYFSDYTSPIVLTITRTGALDREITVDWATENGTALAGIDYTAATGSVTFQPGDTDKTVSIVIVGTQGADAKAFSVKILKASTGGQVTSPSIATVTLAVEETIPPIDVGGSGLYVVATRAYCGPSEHVYIYRQPDEPLHRPGSTIVYYALWCVDLTATVSNRIVLYVLEQEISMDDIDISQPFAGISRLSTGTAAMTGPNQISFVVDRGSFIKMNSVDLGSMKLNAPSFASRPMRSYSPTLRMALSENSLVPFVLVDAGINANSAYGLGFIPLRNPTTGTVAAIGRNYIYVGGESYQKHRIPVPAGCVLDYNRDSRSIGSPSADSTEVFWAGSGMFWQIRTTSKYGELGIAAAWLCKINFATGALSKSVQLPPNTSEYATQMVLMDDGTPMLFLNGTSGNPSAAGQYMFNQGSDTWTQLSSGTEILNSRSFIHNVGNNEVVYVPNTPGKRIARGKLTKTDPLEKLFDFEDFVMGVEDIGPTWLTPDKMFAMNGFPRDPVTSAFLPPEYAIFRASDGVILERGEFNDSYGAASTPQGAFHEVAYKGSSSGYGETYYDVVAKFAPIPVKKAFY